MGARDSKTSHVMENNPDVEGWVILRDGDARFDPEENDNRPYYYHPKYNLIWRRNLMGFGPPLV